MGLPRRASRTLTVGEVAYRWLVTARNGRLGLTVERATAPGQRLTAAFPFQDLYVCRSERVWGHQPWLDCDPGDKPRPLHFEDVGDGWSRTQLTTVSPGTVRWLIRDALALGWRPGERGLPPFRIDGERTLRTGEVLPTAELSGDRRAGAVKPLLPPLLFALCRDPAWRHRLAVWAARREVPAGFIATAAPALGEWAREHGVSISAFFHDADPEDGRCFTIGVGPTPWPTVAVYALIDIPLGPAPPDIGDG
jgi:hypothetical protein